MVYINIKKATSSYQSNLLGVISSESGISFGEGDYPITLSGRTLVKVIGDISIGDPLTSTPGYAAKATQLGRIIGYALENNEIATNTIMVLIEPGWQAGLSLEEETDTPGIFEGIVSAIEELGIMLKNGITYITELVTDKITTKEITTEELKVKADDVSQTGITLYDRMSSEPYCLYIENGVTKTTAGECSAELVDIEEEEEPEEIEEETATSTKDAIMK